jgi:predicted transport protein
LGGDWKDVQAKYLHTLGNLTLTGYNPELSDRPFQTKRDMPGGFRDSPLRLNRGLAQLETWDASQIVLRAERLASVAERVWPQPVLPPEKTAELEYKKVIQVTSYTLDLHAENLKGPILALFEELRKRILNLDSSVREEILKLYIAYKTDTNFVDIIPQKSGLRLSLNMRFDEIDDPRGICRDITGLGKWGNGDVDVRVSSRDDIDNVMPLIHQSFEKHFDGNTTTMD